MLSNLVLFHHFQTPLGFIELRTRATLTLPSLFTSTALPSGSARHSKRGRGGVTSAPSHFTPHQKITQKRIRKLKLLLAAIDCDKCTALCLCMCMYTLSCMSTPAHDNYISHPKKWYCLYQYVSATCKQAMTLYMYDCTVCMSVCVCVQEKRSPSCSYHHHTVICYSK